MHPIGSVRGTMSEVDTRGRLHGFLFIGLMLLLVWLPIPIGSNRGWSLALFEAGALCIFGIWALQFAYRGAGLSSAVGMLRVPLVLLCIWLCFPLLQLVPLPVSVGRLLTGELHGLYAELPGADSPGYLYLSLDRGATLSGMIRQCALVAVFFSVIALVDTRERLHKLLVLVFAVGFAEALYGLALFLGGVELGLWNPGHSAASVSGTYVNQNHFAGLMEMTIPAGMGLLLMDQSSRRTGFGREATLRLLASTLRGQRLIVLFGVMVMFAALILSASRGAVGSLAVAVVLSVVIASPGKSAPSGELKVGLVAVVLALVAVFWLGPGQLATKLESSGLASNREHLRETTYEIIADSPLTGTGLGTYRWVFPGYKDDRFGSGFYEHAHNDYLEILAEQGIIGFSLFAISIVLIAARVVSALRNCPDPLLRAVLFSCVVGCSSLLAHGLVDFNFQIPANAAYFFALLGLGSVAAAWTFAGERRGLDSMSPGRGAADG